MKYLYHVITRDIGETLEVFVFSTPDNFVLNLDVIEAYLKHYEYDYRRKKTFVEICREQTNALNNDFQYNYISKAEPYLILEDTGKIKDYFIVFLKTYGVELLNIEHI